jgi:hypothetical protein
VLTCLQDQQVRQCVRDSACFALDTTKAGARSSATGIMHFATAAAFNPCHKTSCRVVLLQLLYVPAGAGATTRRVLSTICSETAVEAIRCAAWPAPVKQY